MDTPTVKRSPLSVGCALDIQQDVIGYGTTIWSKYGDYVKDRLLFDPCIFLFHPDALEHVLRGKGNYQRGGLLYKGLKVLVGDGLTTSNGELWRKQRRLIQPHFRRSNVDGFVPLIIDEVQKFLDRVETNTVVDMIAQMDQLFLSISCRTLFPATGLDAQRFAQVLRALGPDITSYMRFPFPPLTVPTPRNRRLKRNIADVHGMIEQAIETRRRNPLPGEPDLLQSLLELNDVQQMRDEVLTLVIAGYQTTALSLTFVWSLLAQYPDVAQRLREEIDALGGGQDFLAGDLSQLKYAKAVFMETLRLYPPSFGIMRQALEPDQICGHDIVAGTLVFMSPYFSHRHPDFWDDPEHFLPERFLEDGKRPHHPYAYLPFGGGSHLCVGNHLALVEALIALVMIAQRFDVQFATPAFRPKIQALALTTMKELPMVVKARERAV